MNVLDLFSGIGGFSLGFEAAGMRTIAFCEREKFCQSILRKHWPAVPIHDDVRTLDGAAYRGTIDVVCGGYPCQPFSVAGRRQGEADERHLWPEMLRIIRGCETRWVVAENVAGHIELGFDEVATSLEREGFTVWPFIIPACAVDAPHRRDRLWILAHSKRAGIYERRQHDGIGEEGRQLRGIFGDGLSGRNNEEAETLAYADSERKQQQGGIIAESGGRISNCRENVANTSIIGQQEQGQSIERSGSKKVGSWQAIDAFASSVGNQWSIEPNVGRVANGVPNRMDKLKALGNAVVPQIPYLIGKAIMQYELRN